MSLRRSVAADSQGLDIHLGGIQQYNYHVHVVTANTSIGLITCHNPTFTDIGI